MASVLAQFSNTKLSDIQALAYFSHLTNEIERRKNHRHGKPSRITFIQDSNNPQNKAMA